MPDDQTLLTRHPSGLRMERIACPLFGCADTTVEVTTDDLLCGIPGSFTIERCAQCKHRFMNPRPMIDCMGDCYPKDYGPHQTAVTNTTPPTEHAETISDRSAPAATKPDRPWYLRVLPLRHIPGIRSLYFGLLNDRSQPLPEKDQLRTQCQSGPAPLKALELGCATGLYLQRLQEDGWTVSGVEPGEAAAAMAKAAGFNVCCGTLDSCTQEPASFEFAAAWMVLEHVPDPRHVLTQIHQLLKPGGVLFFSIPNAGCWEPRVFRSRWYAWEPPRHLHHFTPASIRQLLSECGYVDIRITYQRNVSYIIGSLGLSILTRWPSSRLGCWLRDYPGRPKLMLQLLLAPAAHILAWIHQGGRLTISAQRRR
ncbi:MAG: class I SAM-dependent methyltransferase [Planctomycetaceae bacterium]|nr:class I SAM-dependent methyltransferase [Planctomycetaceae bacterium]